MNDIDSFMLGHWSLQGNCPKHCKVKVAKLSSLKLDRPSQIKHKYFKNRKNGSGAVPLLLANKSCISNSVNKFHKQSHYILTNGTQRQDVHNYNYDKLKFVVSEKKHCEISPNSKTTRKLTGIRNEIKLSESETGNCRSKLNRNFGESKLFQNKEKKCESNRPSCIYTNNLISTSEHFKNNPSFRCFVLVNKLKDDLFQSPADLLDNRSYSFEKKTNLFSNKTMTKLKNQHNTQFQSNQSISNIERSSLNSVDENTFSYSLRAAKSNSNVKEDSSSSDQPNEKESIFQQNLDILPRRSARLIKLLEDSVTKSCNRPISKPKINLSGDSNQELSKSNTKENDEPFNDRHKGKKISKKLSSAEHKTSFPISNSGKQKLKVRCRKPTLKYLKERDCLLKGNICLRADTDNDLFLSSFGDKYKNSDLYNFLKNDSEDVNDYLTFLTPNGKLNGTASSMTPRTNLLNEWGKSMKTPTTSLTPQHINKNNKDKQGALAVIYHHLKDKPKMLKNLKPTTRSKVLKTNKNTLEMPQSVMSILREPQNENNDDCLDEYFEEIE